MNRKEKGALTAAFTGGGGKTSLIFYLAKKFSSQGKRVIVTTTTHMAWEPKRPFADAEDTEELCRLIEQYGYVIAAKHKAGQPKISGPEPETLKRLSGFCDLLLVEADGAKRLPLKGSCCARTGNSGICGCCSGCDRAGLHWKKDL